MLEKYVQKSVVSFARRHGVLAHKFSSEARRNVPDYVFLYDGRTYFVEFKANGKTSRAGQIREHKILRAAGFPVDVCDDKVFGRSLIRAFIADALI